VEWNAFIAAEGWDLLAMLLLLGASAFFSGSETVLFNLNSLQLHRLKIGGGPGRLAASLMERPREILNTILLGNMLASVAFAGVSAMMVLSMERADAPGLLVAAGSIAPLLALILFGEVLPKMLGFAAGARAATVVAPPLILVRRVLAPFLWILDKLFIWPVTQLVAPGGPVKTDITAEELAALLDLSARRGVIGHDINSLLQEIVELTDLRVGDIMKPRVDMIACEINEGADALARLFARSRLRRIPVYEKDIDHILGVVHAKRLLLERATPLRQLVTKLPFVPEAANVERLLVQFRVTRTQTAVVVDEYGGTAGLVTLEDVLEEIVGDIPDQHDLTRGPQVERVGDREYLLDGELPIHEWTNAFKMDLSGERISTIGGFVTSLLGAIPRVGDEAAYRNLRFKVVSMRKRRIDKLRLELLERQP
jgi:CBS domain containing-hemolysin-like protein